MRHLIIGGGIAGTTAAEELRRFDADASIVLLSEEHHRLYSRVLLPHYIKGKVTRERVFLKKPEWYAEQRIEWYPGVMATAIDPKNRFVATSDGREYEYDKLLIATGGEVNTLSANDRDTCYFRTLDDADRLFERLNECPERATIIGGGFIALEFVNIFADRQIPAELHLRGESCFASVLDAGSAELIKQKAEADGIVFVPRSTLERPHGLLGVGIGIVPDLRLLRDAGLDTNKGVLTNEYLETSAVDVYAAGDIAEFFDPIVGRRVQAGNWMSAQTQGRVAAKAMVGERQPFRLVSSYATNCRGMEVVFVGDVNREAAEQIIIFGSLAEGGVMQHFLRGGKLVGATLVNRNHDRAAVTKMIQEQTPYV